MLLRYVNKWVIPGKVASIGEFFHYTSTYWWLLGASLLLLVYCALYLKKKLGHLAKYSSQIIFAYFLLGMYFGITLSMHDFSRGRMILCVPNDGAIPGLRDSDVVEITCAVEGGEITPQRVEHPGELQMELIRRVKLYERYASEALRTKSIRRAVDCLMVHPLVNSWSLAKRLAEIYIEANRAFSGGWH